MKTSISAILLLFSVQLSSTEEKTNSKNQIFFLHIKSEVISRFATTLVTSKIENLVEKSEEVSFIVQLPEGAFISNFSMEIGGRVIVGKVKEKEKAKKEYDRAKAAGQSTGHVGQTPRKTNTFAVSVNVAARGKVTFNLTYQEVLKRVHGLYKHIINVHPAQMVQDLQVDVFITETKEITKILVPQFGEKMGQKTNKQLMELKNAKEVDIVSVSVGGISHVHIAYQPSTKIQANGLAGQLVVLYDVERDKSAGELQVVNGYFVHFFAPSNLPLINKQVIFVIDSSGSMNGRKMEQTKEAMKVILEDLDEVDLFNVVEFDNTARLWNSESVYAVDSNIDDAIRFVKQINADGGTNLNEALEKAVNILSQDTNQESRNNSMVIFLTDGQATSGVTNNQQILSNVKKNNKNGEITIQSIGFGSGADFSLLKKLSMQNHGLARKIYEDSDASLQLEGFYSEISSLLLRDVKIKYLNEAVQPGTIVQENIYNYYDGSEFVIVGKIKDKPQLEMVTLESQIDGIAATGHEKFAISGRSVCTSSRTTPDCFSFQKLKEKLDYDPLSPETLGGFVERMWAYLTIKKLLERSKVEYNSSTSEQLKKKALDLSLKYNFVTELTSMVVTQAENDTKPLQEVEQNEFDGDFVDRQSSWPIGLAGRGGSRGASRGGGGLKKMSDGKPYGNSSTGSCINQTFFLLLTILFCYFIIICL